MAEISQEDQNRNLLALEALGLSRRQEPLTLQALDDAYAKAQTEYRIVLDAHAYLRDRSDRDQLGQHLLALRGADQRGEYTEESRDYFRDLGIDFKKIFDTENGFGVRTPKELYNLLDEALDAKREKLNQAGHAYDRLSSWLNTEQNQIDSNQQQQEDAYAAMLAAEERLKRELTEQKGKLENQLEDLVKKFEEALDAGEEELADALLKDIENKRREIAKVDAQLGAIPDRRAQATAQVPPTGPTVGVGANQNAGGNGMAAPGSSAAAPVQQQAAPQQQPAPAAPSRGAAAPAPGGGGQGQAPGGGVRPAAPAPANQNGNGPDQFAAIRQALDEDKAKLTAINEWRRNNPNAPMDANQQAELQQLRISNQQRITTLKETVKNALSARPWYVKMFQSLSDLDRDNYLRGRGIDPKEVKKLLAECKKFEKTARKIDEQKVLRKNTGVGITQEELSRLNHRSQNGGDEHSLSPWLNAVPSSFSESARLNHPSEDGSEIGSDYDSVFSRGKSSASSRSSRSPVAPNEQPRFDLTTPQGRVQQGVEDALETLRGNQHILELEKRKESTAFSEGSEHKAAKDSSSLDKIRAEIARLAAKNLGRRSKAQQEPQQEPAEKPAMRTLRRRNNAFNRDGASQRSGIRH
jgi:hypothetical protein